MNTHKKYTYVVEIEVPYMKFQKVLGLFDNMMENRIQVGRFGGLRHLWVDHAGPHSQVSKNATQR